MRRPWPFVMMYFGSGSVGLYRPLAPKAPSITPTKKPKEPKKKSVYVRKEFPETWLWTEQMVR